MSDVSNVKDNYFP